MKSKLSLSRRLKLIERAMQGEPVSKVAREAGISRPLFYRWLRRYTKHGKDGLIAGEGGRPRKPRTPKHLPSKSLSPIERLRMVEETLEEGRKAIEVAKKYGISRVTFYKWLKRYQEASEKRLKAVEDKKPEVKRYFRQTPEMYEEAVLSLVAKHPEYGIRKIVANLPKIAGKPIVGHHGVQNILRRYDLSTYEPRVAYAQGQITPVTRTITEILRVATRFFTIPFKARTRIIRIAAAFSASTFITIVIFGLGSLVLRPLISVEGVARIGLFFAILALSMGSVFFLYSLKYYITLALVLSFSQQEANSKSQIINDSRKRRSFFDWILGLANGPPAGGGNDRRAKAVGLTPNLEHVALKRKPYVSIHIPFYNEKNVVERAIAASTNFDYPEYEVILCDDSTDETVDIIRNYQKKYLAKGERLKRTENKEEGWELTQVEVKPGVTLKHIHRTSRSGFKGGALRLALTLVDPRTEFVSVFDADFVPYPDTLELFLKYFQATTGTLDFKNNKQQKQQRSNIAAVQGYQWHVLNKSENWITRGIRSEYAGSYVIERSGREIYGALKQISGAVYLIRRDVLEDVGWETSITEDFQLTLKLYEKGYKVVYTPYIQAPAECVSTIKRLIRQRMRWAEGHSNNIRRMFTRLLFGRWEQLAISNQQLVNSNKKLQVANDKLLMTKKFIPSPLTLSEKLEFLYLSPYYLQAFFFLIGTFSWLISETIFTARLPFWTSIWGWSLVLTNFISLPLMNAVGLFLEESEERDYVGLAAFVALSYILVPFQAYAALKGFLEREEGPWFRTPKTGRITDIFTRGKFYRFISGILPGRTQPAVSHSQILNSKFQIPNVFSDNLQPTTNNYLSLSTANNRFDSFQIKPKGYRFIGNLVLIFALVSSLALSYLGTNIKKGTLADLPIQTRVERTGEGSPFAAGLFGVFLPKEVMAAQEKAQGVFISGVKQIPPEALIASSALTLLLSLALFIHLYKRKRRFFKKAVKFVLVFGLIFAWLLASFPVIWKNPRFPPEIEGAESTPAKSPPTPVDNEILSLRQENSKTYDLGGDKRALEASIGAIHYKDDYADASEQWKDIDLSWEGNRITRAPYELTLEGKKISVRDKKTGDVSSIELPEIGGKSLTTPVYSFSKGLARVEGIAQDTDLEIVAENTRVRFTRVLKSDKAPTEAKFRVTGNIPLRTRAEDAEGEVPVEAALKDGILTEQPGSLDRPIKYPVRIDPTLDLQVGASTDDAREFVDANCQLNGTQAIFGHYLGTDDHVGFRFTNVTVPAGANIDSATLEVRANVDKTYNMLTNVFAENVDNSSTFACTTDPTTGSPRYRTATSAFTAWDVISTTWYAGTWYTSPGISSAIQEVVYRSGWSSGNALSILVRDDSTGSSYEYKAVSMWDNNSTYAAKLHITYTLPTYTQSAYRWFNNANSTNVGTALANQNTAFVWAVAQGTPFRLRLLLHVGTAQLGLSGRNFKLQIATRSGTCDTGFVGETYADLSPSSGAIRYYDNSTPADGAALTANANDPTHGSDTIRNQTYEEANNFTNSQVAIGVSEDGKWDFAMVDNSAAANTTYCLRVVKSDNTVLDTYTVIPEFTTVPENPILLFGLYPFLLGMLKRFRRKKRL